MSDGVPQARSACYGSRARSKEEGWVLADGAEQTKPCSSAVRRSCSALPCFGDSGAARYWRGKDGGPGLRPSGSACKEGRTAERGSSARVVSTLVGSRSSATHHAPSSPSSLLLVHPLFTLAVIEILHILPLHQSLPPSFPASSLLLPPFSFYDPSRRGCLWRSSSKRRSVASFCYNGQCERKRSFPSLLSR